MFTVHYLWMTVLHVFITFKGDQDAGDRLWTLPKRIFAPICGGALKVSDYIFKDEEPKVICLIILLLSKIFR